MSRFNVTRSMLAALAAIWFVAGTAAGNASDKFEPRKYFQDSALLSAIASAVANVDSCEEELVFTEQEKKDGDASLLELTISCTAWKLNDGNRGTASVKIIFERFEDGELGPVEFVYNVP